MTRIEKAGDRLRSSDDVIDGDLARLQRIEANHLYRCVDAQHPVGVERHLDTHERAVLASPGIGPRILIKRKMLERIALVVGAPQLKLDRVLLASGVQGISHFDPRGDLLPVDGKHAVALLKAGFLSGRVNDDITQDVEVHGR